MKSIMQRIVGSLGILALFLSLLARPVALHAEADYKMQTVSAGSITSYSFNAHAGDSLSQIVRRALQLRGVSDQPSAMYCENLISTELGNDYLEVNQEVVVSFAQMDTCVAASKGLDADQRAAWQAYADTAVFDVSDINPTNNSSAVVSPQPSEPTSVAPQAQPPAPAPAPAPAKNDKPLVTPAQPAKPATKPVWKQSTFWWYLAAAFTIVYFVVGGPLPHRRVRR